MIVRVGSIITGYQIRELEDVAIDCDDLADLEAEQARAGTRREAARRQCHGACGTR